MFSAGSDFAPRKQGAVPGDMFVCQHWRKVCPWHLVGRDRGAGKRAAARKTAPHHRELPGPDVRVAEVKKLV